MIVMSEQYLHNHWTNNNPLKLRGITWRVGKMNYGDWFLEPMNWQGGETEGHSPDTLWPERINTKNYKV